MKEVQMIIPVLRQGSWINLSELIGKVHDNQGLKGIQFNYLRISFDIISNGELVIEKAISYIPLRPCPKWIWENTKRYTKETLVVSDLSMFASLEHFLDTIRTTFKGVGFDSIVIKNTVTGLRIYNMHGRGL